MIDLSKLQKGRGNINSVYDVLKLGRRSKNQPKTESLSKSAQSLQIVNMDKSIDDKAMSFFLETSISYMQQNGCQICRFTREFDRKSQKFPSDRAQICPACPASEDV